MAAIDESVLRRKRIATYGKNVRKRLPSQIPCQGFYEAEREAVAFETAPVISVPENVNRTDSSRLPLSIPSSSMDFFKEPSVEDEIDTSPQKKRKTTHSVPVPKTKSAKMSIENDLITEWQVTNKPRVTGHNTLGLSHSIHPKIDHDRQKPLQRLSSATKSATTTGKFWHSSTIGQHDPVPESQREKTEGPEESPLKQRSKRSDQSSRLATTADKSPFNEPWSRVDQSVASKKRQSPLSEPVLSAADSLVAHADTSDSVGPSSSNTQGLLTPKGMKMWSGLLGEGNNDVTLRPASSKQAFAQQHSSESGQQARKLNRRSPRQRLIDSLVEQSKDSKHMSDSKSEAGQEGVPKSSFRPQSPGMYMEDGSAARLHVVPHASRDMNNAVEVPSTGQLVKTTGPKFTYSRQRSMLAEKNLTEGLGFDIALDEGIPSTKLKNRRGSIPIFERLQGLYEEDNRNQEQVGVAIRTIHELRQAGAQSRFVDEVEDLLECIGKPSPQNSARRSGLMDLTEKFTDRDFTSKFLTNGMDQRLFLHLGQEEDIISGFLMISLLIIVLDAGITPVAVAQLRRQGITRLLIRLMNFHDNIISIAADRKINMSKSSQVTLSARVHNLLVRDGVGLQSISPRTVSLQCLELMVRQSREAGNTGEIISKELMGKLFAVLRLSYQDKRTEQDNLDIQLALSTLESHSLNAKMALDDYLPIIKDILEMKLGGSCEGSDLTLLHGLVLNVTNNSSTASDAFASTGFLRLMCRTVIEKFSSLSTIDVEEERLVTIDHLVLMLNVMINFAECSSRARECVQALQDTTLDDLIQIFLDNIERAFEVCRLGGHFLIHALTYLGRFRRGQPSQRCWRLSCCFSGIPVINIWYQRANKNSTTDENT